MQDLKNQIAEGIADIEWNSLIPHAQRDALIIVDDSLSMVDVGVALANDDVMSVQHWIAEQLIYKPSPEQLGDWNNHPDRKFSASIVQPFVLIRAVST
jgi:hypothetical protein